MFLQFDMGDQFQKRFNFVYTFLHDVEKPTGELHPTDTEIFSGKVDSLFFTCYSTFHIKISVQRHIFFLVGFPSKNFLVFVLEDTNKSIWISILTKIKGKNLSK